MIFYLVIYLIYSIFRFKFVIKCKMYRQKLKIGENDKIFFKFSNPNIQLYKTQSSFSLAM